MTLEERLQLHLGKTPEIDDSAYIAPMTVILGDVRIGPKSSVWPGCVLRGDINSIAIGEGSNIQDGTVVHLADDFGVAIGNYVTIGHQAMIHACTIEDECLIGMSATILDGAVIGKGSVVGAGALVTKNTKVPPGSVVMGTPGKVVKQLSEGEQSSLRAGAEKYVRVAQIHRKMAAAEVPA